MIINIHNYHIFQTNHTHTDDYPLNGYSASIDDVSEILFRVYIEKSVICPMQYILV